MTCPSVGPSCATRVGEGLLVGIQREGADVIATVHFASVGRKRLSLQTHLEEL